jgi:hypothetical protein
VESFGGPALRRLLAVKAVNRWTLVGARGSRSQLSPAFVLMNVVPTARLDCAKAKPLAQQPRSTLLYEHARSTTSQPSLLWCNALLREVRWWASWRRSLDGMQGITGLPGVPCYGSSCRAKPAGGLEETQPMTWIIIALLFAAAAAAGFRLQALTRDEPPEPPLAHRWRRTMGGG